jgi:ribonuclease HII
VAAAVILAPDNTIRGLNDSKQLDPERREVLAGRIRERAVAWAIAAVDAATIDRINIYQASRMALRIAVEHLRPPPDFLLTDAVPLELAIPQRPLVKGDERCHSIAAASILAKVHRDGMMLEWDKVYPEYHLAANKGYSCPQHLEALARFGATPLHRLSFAPVRAHSRFPAGRQFSSEDQMSLFAADAVCP